MKKTFSENEIGKVAEEILASLGKEERATIVALAGDLGAGKTTLSRAIAQKLGVTENVISPTFVIMKSYPIRKGAHKNLVHIDAYRLDSHHELEKLGWGELAADPENLILIEWPEKVAELIPTHAHRILLEHKEESLREIDF